MRTLVGLALALCGCQLLPQKSVLCSQSDRCEPSVTAPFVLGQGDVRSNFWTTGMQNPTSVALTPDGKLLVGDRTNGRILIWNTFPTGNEQPADYCLGQQDLSQSPTLNTLDDSNYLPEVNRISSDGMKIVAGTSGYFDIMAFWTSFPTTSFATYGYSHVFDNGSSPSPKSFNVAAPLLIGNALYAADQGNSRVMVWNPFPADGNTGATAVMGQMDAMSGSANAGGAVGASTFNMPNGSPASDGTRLFVPDSGNHRVLVWNSLPTGNVAANYVLGQTSLTAGSANQGGSPGLGTLSNPQGVATGGGRFAVADTGNHRVLLWHQVPTTSGQAADLVVGQASGTAVGANNGGISASSVNGPQSVATDGTRLVVADSANNRVLIWNTWPTTNGQAADLILGQPLPNTNAARGTVVTASRFFAPISLARAGNQLVVVDRDASRVLLYPQLPTDPTAMPQVVLGQPNFTASGANTGGISANALSSPLSAASNGTSLLVSDSGNHRVLIWNSLPTQNNQAADMVLGQLDLSANGANAGSSTKGLMNPSGVFLSSNLLMVADTGNNRVLIWKQPITVNQQSADIVLGQADLTGTSPLRGGMNPTADNLKSPGAVFADDSHIYVSDSDQNRILIWNTLTPANGQAADMVIGQPDLMTNKPNGASEFQISGPRGLRTVGTRLYAADYNYNRIIFWDPIPTQPNVAASGEIGQPTIGTGSVNTGGISAARLFGPSDVLVTTVGIYIADTNNNRVLALPPLPDTPPGP